MNEQSKKRVHGANVSTCQEDRTLCIEEFSNKLPRLPSHNCRASSTKLYLEPLVQNFADVYRLYMSKWKEMEQHPMCRLVVKQIFDKLNWPLFRPRKNQCDVGVGYDCYNVDGQVLWLKLRGAQRGRTEGQSSRQGKGRQILT